MLQKQLYLIKSMMNFIKLSIFKSQYSQYNKMLNNLPRRNSYHLRNKIKPKLNLPFEKKITQLTPQERAQSNLIQISNSEFIAQSTVANNTNTNRQQQSEYPRTAERLLNSTAISLRKNYGNNKSEEFRRSRQSKLRMSVTQRLTQSFKAGLKPSLSERQTKRNKFKSRKLPINLSHYLLLDSRGPDQRKMQNDEIRKHSPRFSINSRTFFKKKSDQIPQQSPKNTNKLNPVQESYWKIFSKHKSP